MPILQWESRARPKWNLILKKRRDVLNLHELADVRDVTKLKVQVIELGLGQFERQPREANLLLVPEAEVLTAKYFDIIVRWPVWVNVLYFTETPHPCWQCSLRNREDAFSEFRRSVDNDAAICVEVIK